MSVKTSQMTFNLLEGNNDLKIHLIVTTGSKCTEQRKKTSNLPCVYTSTYYSYSMQDHKIYLNTFMQ